MADLDKVKKGLEAHGCGKSVWRICGNCPYRKEDDPFFDPRIDPNYDSKLIKKSQRCMDELLKDVSYLLEARVLTLEEVKRMGLENARHNEPMKTCIIEYKTRSRMYATAPEWTEWDNDVEFLFFHSHETERYFLNRYGIGMRCWNFLPTDEQREATPWE